MVVKEICYKRQVQAHMASDNISRRNEATAVQLACCTQDHFGPLHLESQVKAAVKH